MPLITTADVTIDATPDVQAPRGFLRARALGMSPDALYDEQLAAIVAAVNAHLDAYNINPNTATAGRYKLAARSLARYYAAEAVLTAAQTGTDRDQTGASTSLSSSDLAHWQKMKDEGTAIAERILGPAPGTLRGGVYFPKVRLTRNNDDAAS